MFKLRLAPAADAVWDALPAEAREELDDAIFRVCQDPYGATTGVPGDESVKRTLTLRHTVVALVVIDAPPVRRVRVLSINYLG